MTHEALPRGSSFMKLRLCVRPSRLGILSLTVYFFAYPPLDAVEISGNIG